MEIKNIRVSRTGNRDQSKLQSNMYVEKRMKVKRGYDKIEIQKTQSIGLNRWTQHNTDSNR